MRPNSLFFDRGGKQGFVRTASMILTLAFLALMGYILIRYQRFGYLLRGELLTTPRFGWLLLGYLALAFCAVFFIRWTNCRARRLPALWAAAIFLFALLARALALLVLRAPAFGGEVFARPNLAALFLPENLPALLFCAASALAAAVVYLIARRFDDGSAPAAGLLFALYPAGIFLSLEQPAVPIVVLLALLAVLFALVSLSALRRGRAAAFAALSGLSLALSGVALASAWVIALAFCAFWLILLLGSFRIEKEPVRLFLVALAFCAVLMTLRAFAPAVDVGRMDGGLPDATAAGAAQQAREGEAILDALNWDTLRQGYGVQGSPARLDENLIHLWLEKDAALASATQTASFSASALFAYREGIRLLDFFYVAGILLFAWIGGLLRRRGGAGDLLLWVFLAWAGAHLFCDRQMITRAIGMPILMIYAAYGVFAIAGTEPRAKERSKYDACVNRGALNLGDIPAADAGLDRAGAFHPAGAGGAHQSRARSGLYARMEADIAQKEREQASSITDQR